MKNDKDESRNHGIKNRKNKMNPKADSLKRPVNKPLKNIFLDFPGGPVFKTHASNAGGTGPSLVQGTKIPHAM